MKNKQFFTGLTALVLSIGLVLAGCDNGSTDDDPSGPTAAELATALAAELNALTPGAATATDATVEVTGSVTVTSTVTVPSGVTLNVTCTSGLEVASSGNVTVNGILCFTGNDANGHINGTLTVKSGGTYSEPDGMGRVWGGTSANNTTAHTATGTVIIEAGGTVSREDASGVIVGDEGRIELGTGARMFLTKSSYRLADGNATVKKLFAVTTGMTLTIDANRTLNIDITEELKVMGIQAGVTVIGGDNAKIDIKAGNGFGVAGATNGLTVGNYIGPQITTCTSGTWSSLNPTS
jgi:hypothetical protein